MIQTHYIKLNHHFCDAVLNGDKNFEIRRNDRGYQKGDRVIFQAVNDEGITMEHEVNRVAYMITYVLHGFGLQDGYCVFGIKPWNDKTDEVEE